MDKRQSANVQEDSNGNGKVRPFSDAQMRRLKIDWKIQGAIVCVCVIGLYASGYGSFRYANGAAVAWLPPALVCLAAAHAASFLAVRETMTLLGLPGLALPSYLDGCVGEAVKTTVNFLLIFIAGLSTGIANATPLFVLSIVLLVTSCIWASMIPAVFSKNALLAADKAIKCIDLMARNGELDEYLEKDAKAKGRTDGKREG